VWGLIASLFIANVMLLVHQHPDDGPVHKGSVDPQLAAGAGHGGDQRWWACMRCMPPPSTWCWPRSAAVGYLLRKQELPDGALILGFVLGDMMEQNLRRALSISDGDAGVLVASPISIGLWLGAAAMVLVPPLLRLFNQRRTAAAAVL
jgi:putative tricarboxylic transport membrane protein